MQLEVSLNSLNFRLLDIPHPSFIQSFLPGTSDFSQPFHALNGLDHVESIVPHWLIPSLLKLQHWVIHKFLALRSTVSLGPLDLLWVALGLE